LTYWFISKSKSQCTSEFVYTHKMLMKVNFTRQNIEADSVYKNKHDVKLKSWE